MPSKERDPAAQRLHIGPQFFMTKLYTVPGKRVYSILGITSINQSKFICRNNNDMNIYMAIINSGRLPEKPNGSMNWLPNTN